MDTTEVIDKIAKKDFDVNEFVQLAIAHENIRKAIIRHMLTDPSIMVYYHCYYVVEKASQKRPDIFYPYWDDIAGLLRHKNSYHRDFALEILGNLTQVDKENRFAEIADEYFGIVNDEKFMTGNCCVKNLIKIYRYKTEHRERIIETLLDIDNRCDYSDRQKAVLKADVLEIFDEVYSDLTEQEKIEAFIKEERHSISPKTRAKARQLVEKYGL